MDYNDYHEENFSAWGMPKKKRRGGNDFPDPVEKKTRLGQINDLLDERLSQTKALSQAEKMKGGNKLISILKETIINIDVRLNKLK